MSPKITSARNLLFLNQKLISDWESSLKSFELDLFSDETELASKRPYFIIVEGLSDLSFEVNWDCKIFVTGKVPVDLKSSENGKFFSGKLNLSLLSSNWGKSLLARSFHFPDTFSELTKEEEHSLYRFNCPHLLAFGTYSDHIFIELVSRGFKVDQVKHYLDELFFFYSTHIQSGLIKAPFEIDLIVFQDWFSLQILAGCEEYWFEYLEAGNLEQILNQTSALEVLFLRNSKKLCFTSIHSKEVREEQSLSLQNIDSFAVKEQMSWDIPSNQNDLEDIAPEARITDSPDIEIVSTENKLAQLKRVIRFLKNRMTPEDIKNLTVENLKEHLTTYPNPRVVRSLDGEDYKFVVKCVHDSIVGSEFEKSFDEVYNQEASEDFLDDMLTKLGKMSFEEAGESIFDGSSDFEETLTRVGGWVDSAEEERQIISGNFDEAQESTVVRGQREDLAADQKHKTVIKGGNKVDGPDNEVVASFSKEEFASRAKDLWEVKKLGLAEKVRSEVEKIRHENPSVERVSEIVRSVVSSELNIESSDCEHFVEGLIDSSSEKLVEQKLGRSSEEVREQLQNLKHQLEMDKRDDQIRRMKRIIDSMKGQLAEKLAEGREAQAEERSEAISENREWQTKLNTLETENQELKRNLRAMELKHDAALEASASALEVEQEPEADEDTISKNVAEEIIEREKARAEREIDELSGKVQVAEGRIEVMSAKLEEERRASAEAVTQKTAAESRSNMTAAAMSKYKARAESLEKKVKQLEESLAHREAECDELKAKTSDKDVNPAELEAKIKDQEKEITGLKNTLGESEKNLKGALLKVKQLEQKTKFMTSQLDEAQKAKSRGGPGGSGGASNQQLEHKIKQLEMMNKKVGAASQKLNDELTEKKKEVLDLKKENTLLQNKLKDLERKNGKKAA